MFQILSSFLSRRPVFAKMERGGRRRAKLCRDKSWLGEEGEIEIGGGGFSFRPPSPIKSPDLAIACGFYKNGLLPFPSPFSYFSPFAARRGGREKGERQVGSASFLPPAAFSKQVYQMFKEECPLAHPTRQEGRLRRGKHNRNVI